MRYAIVGVPAGEPGIKLTKPPGDVTYPLINGKPLGFPERNKIQNNLACREEIVILRTDALVIVIEIICRKGQAIFDCRD